MRKWIGVLAGCVCCAGAQPLQAQTFWTAGHGDLGIGFEGSNLAPHWHLGEGNEEVVLNGTPQTLGPDGQEFEAVDITPRSSISNLRPAGAAWDPMGISSGQTYYAFPQTDTPGAPFVGVGTEELTPSDWAGSLSLELTAFSGPAGGYFSLYTVGIGPTFFMATSDGVSSADTISLVPGSHTHYNWAFTEQGTYSMTFAVSGTSAASGLSTEALAEGMTADTSYTNSATYTFSVIPEPSSFALLGLGLGGLVAFRRRKK